MDLINISLAFIEGFALIISPCILPVLPIILSGSLTGTKARPLGIISGFIVIFSLILLSSRFLVQYAHLDPTLLRMVAFSILILLGVIMLSSTLTEKFSILTNKLLNIGSSIKTAQDPRSGFWGGFVFGGMAGIIWTPCAGPILAAIIVQIAIQQTTLNSALAIIAFAIGAGVPMLFIALIGRRMMEEFQFFKTHAVLCRKILGGIIIASVGYLIYDSGVTMSYAQPNPSRPNAESLINGLTVPYKAPAIEGIDAWINSPPLQLNQLKGKVVLIDFWTYSCINCIRTLPYLRSWYDQYHNKGFEIIGIHTPEFEFEKKLDNVQNAVKKFGIHYPVALDNGFVTWQNFNNHYWPAHYLINKEGDIVYIHFGEGEYDVTENNIRYLLGLKGSAAEKKEEKSLSSITPETYLGYARSETFSNLQTPIKNKSQTYQYPDSLPLDGWALQGNWIIYADKIVAASSDASIKLHFRAKHVYAVMGAPIHPVPLNIRLNGKASGEINVLHQQLYTVVELKQSHEGTVELIAQHPNLELYTFTFGN